jgi:2-amino-4-hydroxy-6-hydroxymethyldihydropteridine diphosphokinase
MTLCHIALGGNLGDVRNTFAAALHQLSGDDIDVRAASRLYTTPAMGSDAGGEFLNAAASLETTLEPLTLLDRLLAVEDSLGRRRDVRWGPRLIDLDLILFGGAIIDHPRLRVPHPGSWYRRFVLDPLTEIAADAIHAELGEAIGTLRSRLLARPFVVACDDELLRSRCSQALSAEFPEVEWSSPRSAAALTLSQTPRRDGFRARAISVPSDAGELVETARAILVAALSRPVVSEPFDRSVNDLSS